MKRAKTKKTGLSQVDYAIHRGCSPNTVFVAIRSGRLKKCLLPNGRIRSATEADAEWAKTTKEKHVPRVGVTAPRLGADAEGAMDLAEARLRHESADAEKAEIDVARMKGELLVARDVEDRMVAVFASCKTKLLGIPSRARQADPALTSSQVTLIEELVREALEDLAAGKFESDGE